MEETRSSRKYIATKYQRDMERSAAKLLYIITSQKDNYDRTPIHYVISMQNPHWGGGGYLTTEMDHHPAGR